MCDEPCKQDSPCEECAASPDYWVDEAEEVRKFDIDNEEV